MNIEQKILDESFWRFSATEVKSDLGVRGSPDIYDAEDIKLDSVEMFGRDWTEEELKERFGEQGANALIEEAQQMIDPFDWS